MEKLVVKNTTQEKQNKTSKMTWLIVAAAAFLTLINCLVYQCNKAEVVEKVTTDTVFTTDTVMETDTFCFYQPTFKTEYIYRWDTLYTPQDTTPIPYKRVQYEDSVIKDNGATVLYYASVSGYEPSLDTLDFNVTYPVITNTEYITTTIEKQKPAPRLTIGPSIGFGYGIFTKQPDLYAGLSLTYRF